MLSNRRISWRFVTGLCASLLAGIALVAVLWPQPAKLSMPPAKNLPPAPFLSSVAFENTNDVLVLRAAAEKICNGPPYAVLSSQPIEHAGSRAQPKRDSLLKELSCPAVKVVDAQKIAALLDAPYRGDKKDFKFQGGWGNFYDEFPGASGVIYLGLPSYPSPDSAIVYLDVTGCFRCGAGWQIDLRKIHGKWKVQRQVPRWIA